MRTRYRANFRLGTPNSDAVPLEQVATACVRWAMKRGSKVVDLAVDRDVAREDYGKGAEIETLRLDDVDGQNWALRLVHPDEDYDNIRWRTDIALSNTAQGLMFSCANSYGTVDGVVVPMRRQPSRPRIVVELLKKWGGYRTYPLKVGPDVLRDRDEDIDGFFRILTDPHRTLPVVFVSALFATDEPVVDAIKLADYLAGVAHVWVADNRFPSLKLKNRMPPNLVARDGSVRIYWPLFSVYGDSYNHPYWRPVEIRELEELKRQGFKEFLLGRVSEVAIYSRAPSETRWSDLEARRRRRAMEDLRKNGQEKEILDIALAETEEQERKIKVLETEIQDLRKQLTDISAVRDDAEKGQTYWRNLYFSLKAGDSEKAAEEEGREDRPPEVTSVKEAYDRANERFANRLVFELNGKSDVKRNPFKAPDDLYRALEFLATIYWEARVDGGDGVDFDEELRNFCGWKYKANQKTATMKKYWDWYHTTWNGKSYELPSHIGTGSSKNAQFTIRVGFNWDEKVQRVIIGFIGQHQETDAT